MNASRRLTLAMVVAALTLTVGRNARADTVVQVPIDSLLNGRAVSTLTGGVVVRWTVGVDGGGNSDGYVTNAVETFLNYTGVALPDDGLFAADTNHPEVILHFSNSAPATSNQTHYVQGAGMFQFAVPQATYSKMFLFMTSSEGAQPLMTVVMTYADATTSIVSVPLPDYGSGQPLPTTPPIFFNLISGMHKWNTMDVQVDTTGHTITGVTLAPTPNKALTSIQVNKPNTNYLVFWGATGIATSPVDAGTPLVDGGGSSDATFDDAGGDASGGATSGAGSGGSSSSGTSSSGAGGSTGSTSSTGAASGSTNTGSSGTTVAPGNGSKSGCSCSVTPATDVAGPGSLFVLLGIARRRLNPPGTKASRASRTRCGRSSRAIPRWTRRLSWQLRSHLSRASCRSS